MAFEVREYSAGQVLKADDMNNIMAGISANAEEITKNKQRIMSEPVFSLDFSKFKTEEELDALLEEYACGRLENIEIDRTFIGRGYIRFKALGENGPAAISFYHTDLINDSNAPKLPISAMNAAYVVIKYNIVDVTDSGIEAVTANMSAISTTQDGTVISQTDRGGSVDFIIKEEKSSLRSFALIDAREAWAQPETQKIQELRIQFLDEEMAKIHSGNYFGLEYIHFFANKIEAENWIEANSVYNTQVDESEVDKNFVYQNSDGTFWTGSTNVPVISTINKTYLEETFPFEESTKGELETIEATVNGERIVIFNNRNQTANDFFEQNNNSIYDINRKFSKLKYQGWFLYDNNQNPSLYLTTEVYDIVGSQTAFNTSSQASLDTAKGQELLKLQIISEEESNRIYSYTIEMNIEQSENTGFIHSNRYPIILYIKIYDNGSSRALNINLPLHVYWRGCNYIPGENGIPSVINNISHNYLVNEGLIYRNGVLMLNGALLQSSKEQSNSFIAYPPIKRVHWYYFGNKEIIRFEDIIRTSPANL